MSGSIPGGLDFHWLSDALAVGSKFSAEFASQLAAAEGVGAVVDLRAEDCDDADLLGQYGIAFLHLPTPDTEPVSVAMLEEGVSFIRGCIQNGKKVLIHCEHGIGRSALLALCVLVDQGWEPLAALEHAKNRRDAVSPSKAQYEGWAAWLRSRGTAAPDYHSFGCIAYRHLAS